MSDPRGKNVEIHLAPVSEANRALVLSLQLAPEQVDFVASNLESLEEAALDEDARPRVILADGRVVGFLMYEAPDDEGEALIYRFMIDQACQGRGYGKAALSLLLEEIRALAHIRHVSICYEPENEAARQLYRKAGFVEEGLDEDGEMIAALALQT